MTNTAGMTQEEFFKFIRESERHLIESLPEPTRKLGLEWLEMQAKEQELERQANQAHRDTLEAFQRFATARAYEVYGAKPNSLINYKKKGFQPLKYFVRNFTWYGVLLPEITVVNVKANGTPGKIRSYLHPSSADEVEVIGEWHPDLETGP